MCCAERAAAEARRQRARDLEALADELEPDQAREGEPDQAPPTDAAAFRLGEVVWAREKGWPAWPALVITRETSRDLAALRALLLPPLCALIRLPHVVLPQCTLASVQHASTCTVMSFARRIAKCIDWGCKSVEQPEALWREASAL
jgi:hypothetical protein